MSTKMKFHLRPKTKRNRTWTFIFGRKTKKKVTWYRHSNGRSDRLKHISCLGMLMRDKEIHRTKSWSVGCYAPDIWIWHLASGRPSILWSLHHNDIAIVTVLLRFRILLHCLWATVGVQYQAQCVAWLYSLIYIKSVMSINQSNSQSINQ